MHNLGDTGDFQSLLPSRYDLAALSASTIKPFFPLSTLFDDTKESTLCSTTKEVIASCNNTLESPQPKTMPRYYTTSQASIDGLYSSITEPSTGIDDSREESTTNKTSTGTVKAEGSVEEASSAIANACTLANEL